MFNLAYAAFVPIYCAPGAIAKMGWDAFPSFDADDLRPLHSVLVCLIVAASPRCKLSQKAMPEVVTHATMAQINAVLYFTPAWLLGNWAQAHKTMYKRWPQSQWLERLAVFWAPFYFYTMLLDCHWTPWNTNFHQWMWSSVNRCSPDQHSWTSTLDLFLSTVLLA